MGTAAPIPTRVKSDSPIDIRPTRTTPVVERLEAALALAKRLGYRLRLDALGGDGGGGCEIRGQKWLFVDLSLSPPEQLEQVLTILRREAAQLRAAARVAQRATASAESAQTDESAELSAPAPESPRGFLPSWRRWYRMIFGSRRRQAG